MNKAEQRPAQQVCPFLSVQLASSPTSLAGHRERQGATGDSDVSSTAYSYFSYVHRTLYTQ